MLELSVLLLLTAAALFSALVTFQAWRLRPTSGSTAVSMSAMMLAVTFWIVVYMVELLMNSYGLKLLASQLKFAAIVLVPVAWLAFALQYTGREALLTRRSLALLLAVPALTTLVIWTNDAHALMWVRSGMIVQNGFLVLNAPAGPYFWVHSAYSYLLIMSGVYLLLRQFMRAPGLYRRQLVAVFVAVAAPMAANAVTIFGSFFFDFTPLAFAITGFAFFWGLLRYQLLNITPIARNLVIDSMSDGMIVLDTQDRIVDVNPAAQRIVRWTAKEIIGRPIGSVVRLLAEQLHLMEVYRQAAPMQGEIAFSEAGQDYHLEVRVSPLYDSHQHLTGRVVVFRDITERKQAEQRIQAQNDALSRANEALAAARHEAEQATQLKSHFLATMSHELRTPLTAIIGYTEIALAGMVGPLTAEQTQYQGRVLANAEHLLGLINDVLDLSKIEAGRMELVNAPFALRPWLEDIAAQNRVLASEKALVFETAVDDDLPDRITADADRLKQVLINLLSNAFKFTEAGRVGVCLERGGEQTWRIVVSDTGAGIPPHAQETIFEEFRQLDGSTQRQHGGTGLGLAIVRRLVAMMGGSIHLRSEVGAGSTFTVTLPLVQEIELFPQDVQ